MSEDFIEELNSEQDDSADTKKVSEADLVEKYQKHFDKNLAMKLLVKLRKSTRNKPKAIAGTAEAIVSVLGKLLSALDNPETPTHIKALVIGAIGYIILPIDLIPDFTPGIGYADDIASAAGVVTAVGIYSDFSLEKLDEYIDQLDSKK